MLRTDPFKAKTMPTQLSTVQLSQLKTAIAADPALEAQPNNPDGHEAIANALNLSATPDWWVWRTQVTDQEIMLNGFDWTRVDNLSVGKARIWDWMFRFGSIDPSKPNIRAGIDATWVGTAGDLAVRAAVYVHCKRKATRAEKLFATTGVGADGQQATPATMTFQGNLTRDDVETARNLP